MSGLRMAATVFAVVLAMGTAGASKAEAPSIEAYGASPAIDNMELSPSGELIARIVVVDEVRALAVTRVKTGEHLFTASIGDAKVRDLRWIGDRHVLIVSSQTQSIPDLGVPRSELFYGMILDLETKTLAQVLSRTPDVLASPYGGVEVRRTSRGEIALARGVNVVTGRIDLYRIDLSTGRGRLAETMDRDADDYVLDGEGAVIAVSRYAERSGRWSLRLPDGRGFREAWAVDALLDRPSFRGLGRTPRTIIVNAERPDLTADDVESETGFLLFEVNVDTGEWSRLPFKRHPDFLFHHPRTGLLIGSGNIEAEGVRYDFFDVEAGRRWRGVERAFPGKALRLVSWSDDLKSAVVFSDTRESGVYHLVDFDAGVANVVGDAYPSIPEAQVGEVRPIRYSAADGLDIHGYLTLPPGADEPTNLPLVVLAHGGPASRDVAGFDYWAQAMASRGYAVLQANFRGSLGYGRAFLEAGYGEWGRKMQTDLSDGVRWLVAEGIVDPARVCIVGASYGGYAAMAGLTLDKGVYRCGVSVSGVSDLRRMVNREAYLDGERNSPTVRYWNRFMGAARLNDRSLDALSPAMLASAVDSPLLLIHGKDDTVVPIEQSRFMAEAMRRAGKPVEMIELPGEDHWMSRADTRRWMLRETVRFLEAHNPPVEGGAAMMLSGGATSR
ncbi:acetyl esterase/lipase [Brevundimonas faecalis]|uniref:Acetyl esterase/lipase n=2 Tax=Brevundimonas faecalis TaxID=947378 RepID=A0ABV2RBS8_9CAUL